MQILIDSCLALLASIGLWSVLKLIFQWLFPSACSQGIYCIICLNGDAIDCELRLRRQLRNNLSTRIILLDCGLTETGKEFIAALAQSYENVWASSPEYIEMKVKETEWLK